MWAMQGCNQSCLQQPRQQTFARNSAFPRPHHFITAALYDPDNPNATFTSKNGKTVARRERASNLRAFMAEEEAEIDRKMRHIQNFEWQR